MVTNTRKEGLKIISGTDTELAKNYADFANKVNDLGGRIHGSQSQMIDDPTKGPQQKIFIYYQIPSTTSIEDEVPVPTFKIEYPNHK